MTLKEKLITNGVKNLHEFGYEYATPENILTDEVYSSFFEVMLEESEGHNEEIDKVIE